MNHILYDNRKQQFTGTYRDISKQIKSWFVAKPYAQYGHYLYDTGNSDTLCHNCAKRQFIIHRMDIFVNCYNSGPALHCEECGTVLVSEYGDPNCEICHGNTEYHDANAYLLPCPTCRPNGEEFQFLG